ncbi:unnamed protein product [Phytophthora lilii]|uniref:Unnamed protein product n=1 Tax=Phytophthora lilii TaxID=2077276 RepID=A0A9W7CNI6_9STRA|nr:unnamed protein product [Phytophthora lilii]
MCMWRSSSRTYCRSTWRRRCWRKELVNSPLTSWFRKNELVVTFDGTKKSTRSIKSLTSEQKVVSVSSTGSNVGSRPSRHGEITVLSIVQKSSMSEEDVSAMYEYTKLEILFGDATIFSISETRLRICVFDSNASKSVSVQVLDIDANASSTE